MDVFTIILVFLLKTYSAEGQLIQPSEFLTLPHSTVKTIPEVALDVDVSKEWIFVNKEPIESISTVTSQPGLIIETLQAELLKFAGEAKNMEEKYGIPFSGRVTIQGDKDIPYRVMVKVMATCGRSEYPNMRLAVYREDA
jgi:biopolymer transport protein ExbD